MVRINGFLGRRHLLKAMGLAGISVATATACSQQSKTASAPSPVATTVADKSVMERPETDSMTPDDALKLLMDGHQRFLEGKTVHPRQDRARLAETGADQFPFAAFLSCADSRVPVEEIFDQGIGDCFVTRVAGNIATEQMVGSLEFGTAVLGCKVLMVIGHERCGAVVASMGRATLPDNPGKIPSLVPLISPAVKAIESKVQKEGVAAVGNDVEETIKVNVKQQVANLNQSPILSQLVKDGQLKIHAAYYDLDTGKIEILDEQKA